MQGLGATSRLQGLESAAHPTPPLLISLFASSWFQLLLPHGPVQPWVTNTPPPQIFQSVQRAKADPTPQSWRASLVSGPPGSTGGAMPTWALLTSQGQRSPPRRSTGTGGEESHFPQRVLGQLCTLKEGLVGTWLGRGGRWSVLERSG